MVEMVDLSGRIEEGQPVYPGHEKTQILPTSTHEETGFTAAQRMESKTESIERHLSATDDSRSDEHPLVRSLLVSEHGPTHLDAPTHLDPKADESVDCIPLERCYTDAICVDVSHLSPDEPITVQRLDSALDSESLYLSDGDTLVLRTGHYDEYYSTQDIEQKYQFIYHYTGLTPDATEWCVEQGVEAFAVDTPSLDPHPDALEEMSYPAHSVCAEHDALILENLCNLDAVAGERFTLCFFPLKIKDGTGSPIRPVAIFDDA